MAGTKVDFSKLERCCDGHYYQFDSGADMKRHFDLCHAGEPTLSFCKNYFSCSRTLDGKKCEFKCDSRADLGVHVDSVHQRSKKRSLGQSARESPPSSTPPRVAADCGNAQSLKQGARVNVWFDCSRKYFSGTIKRVLNSEKYKCMMDWDDGRAKKEEVVFLEPEHNTTDSSDSDRWNFL